MQNGNKIASGGKKNVPALNNPSFKLVMKVANNNTAECEQKSGTLCPILCFCVYNNPKQTT